jgi:hypothetical protein
MTPGHNTDLVAELAASRKIIEENNKLLHRLDRNARWAFWLQVVWYMLLIGLPFAVYFYVLGPYFEALGSSYETFSAGMQEIPGWKLFHEYVGGTSSTQE